MNDKYATPPIPDLTDDQKKIIVARWNDKTKDAPSLSELCELVYPNQKIHPRSHQANKIKVYLAHCHSAPASTNVITRPIQAPPIVYELTDEQKIVIHENFDSATPLTIHQLAETFFGFNCGNDGVHCVRSYINSLPKDLYGSKKSVLKYSPPESLVEAAHLVNRASYKAIDLNKLEKDPVKKECLSCLIKFLHTFRVALTYETYTDDIEKALFETSFVKFVWDKPDLTPEEIDLYINLCVDIVGCERLKKEEAYLLGTRESIANDTDGRKISMSIVESLAGLRKERDDNQTRQSKTIQMLQGKRSDRIDSKQKENSSVLQLIAAWRDAEKRNRLIKFAEERKELVRGELSKLDSMDLFKAELWGVNPESFDYQSNPENTVSQEKDDNV